MSSSLLFLLYLVYEFIINIYNAQILQCFGHFFVPTLLRPVFIQSRMVGSDSESYNVRQACHPQITL